MKETEIIEILKAIAACQGAFVFGITVIIFFYYFTRVGRMNWVGWHTVLISISYLLIIGATMMSIFREKYDLRDWWYWIIFTGYLVGDLSLIFLFRHVLIKANKNK